MLQGYCNTKQSLWLWCTQSAVGPAWRGRPSGGQGRPRREQGAEGPGDGRRKRGEGRSARRRLPPGFGVPRLQVTERQASRPHALGLLGKKSEGRQFQDWSHRSTMYCNTQAFSFSVLNMLALCPERVTSARAPGAVLPCWLPEERTEGDRGVGGVDKALPSPTRPRRHPVLPRDPD